MDDKQKLTCSECGSMACRENVGRFPEFCLTKNATQAEIDEAMAVYRNDEEALRMFNIAAVLEHDFYCKLTRVEETIEFIKRMGYKKVGIATCVGLMREASTFARILKAKGIECYTCGCKIGAVDKTELGIPEEKKLNGGCRHESMCNPVMQAQELEREGCEFVIVMGLCVGHDTMFFKTTNLPTTVMVVKDRVLQHAPALALYGVNTGFSRFKDIGM